MMNETPEAALRSRIADLERQLKLADEGTSRLAQRCLELEKQLQTFYAAHPQKERQTDSPALVQPLLYYDAGFGFSQKDTAKAPDYEYDELNGMVTATCELPETAFNLRFDPGELPCCITDLVFSDDRILCRLVRELDGIDTSRVFVNGGSQGGGLGLACAALNPELIDRAAILYPFLSDFKLVWDLGADEIAYEGLRYYARWFDADEHQQNRWFRQLGYIDSKNFAPMIRCPVLFGTGLDDVICPPQTQCAVYNNLHCAKKRYLFPGCGHEEIPEFDDMLLDFFTSKEAVL